MASNSKRRSTSDTDTDIGTPKKKHAKLNTQKYKTSYGEYWPCLGPSYKGKTYVHCVTCNIDFLCAHGGKNDCKRHVDSQSHVNWRKIKASNKNISTMMQGSNIEKELKTTHAEVIMCEFIAQNNLSLSSANTLTETMKAMFPDSEIAQSKLLVKSNTYSLFNEVQLFLQLVISYMEQTIVLIVYVQVIPSLFCYQFIWYLNASQKWCQMYVLLMVWTVLQSEKADTCKMNRKFDLINLSFETVLQQL